MILGVAYWGLYVCILSTPWAIDTNIGALIIRIGFWGPLWYNQNKEPPIL